MRSASAAPALHSKPMSRHNVLFAVHDWGLGHATRDLLLIRGLLEAGHAVTIISAGRALMLLRQELARSCEFIELADIPKPLSRWPALFYIRMSLALPRVFQVFHRERQIVERLCRERRFDRVVSDSRYGVCSREVPSFYINHSLRQIIPGRPRGLEKFVECAQKKLLGGAQRILIPDQREDGLAGELCHDVACDWGERLEYIGILSSIRRRSVEQDIDCFVSVSGAEPQRTIFEKTVLAQARDLPGRVIIALGRPDVESRVQDDGRVAIHGYMDRARQEEMMNRARLVISRSGYTTLMELAELGKRALLVPTAGQSEQEYLARYHERQGHAYGVAQSDLRLARDAEIASAYSGLPSFAPSSQSVGKFMAAVCG